ncbi:MAG: serine/threonine-protein kinase [Myxococcota bacterium]
MIETTTSRAEPTPRFGKYRLLKRIGTGGMAQIYLAAIDGPDGFSKTCVIKRILPEYARLDDFSRMLITEAKVAAMLSHPNIVQVFDFGKIRDDYFIAMELVDGGSLEAAIKQSAKLRVPLGVRVAVNVGIPLCDALAYAHAMVMPNGAPLNLVHRDVTPGNILISHTGVVKLTDFGVVKAAVAHTNTTAGVVKGKFAYMAPEQVRNQPIDHRADIFSLGIVLYELSTGRWLFRRAETAAVLNAVANAEVPPPSTVLPGFPPEFERILMKALARERTDRYNDARELLSDLEAFRAAQQWTSSARDLAVLMQKLFPERTAMTTSSPGTWQDGVDDTPTSFFDAADAPTSQARRGRSWLPEGLAVAASIVGTAVFWLLVISSR